MLLMSIGSWLSVVQWKALQILKNLFWYQEPLIISSYIVITIFHWSFDYIITQILSLELGSNVQVAKCSSYEVSKIFFLP